MVQSAAQAFAANRGFDGIGRRNIRATAERQISILGWGMIVGAGALLWALGAAAFL
jgi:hypothetical protein